MSDSESETGPLFSIDFGDGVIFSPRSIKELNGWIDQEAQFWNWISGVEMQGEGGNSWVSLKSDINRCWKEIHDLTNKLSSAPPETQQGVTDSISSSIRSRFGPGKRKLLHASATPIAQKIKQLVDSSQSLEAAAMLVLSVRFQNSALGYFISAGAALYAFDHGFSSNLDAEKKSLEKLRNKYSEVLEEWNSEFANHQSKNLNLTEEHEKSIHEFRDSTGILVGEHSEEMQKIRSQFRDEMAVKSAVKYWDTKEKEHRESASKWGIVAASFFFIAALILMGLFPKSEIVETENGKIKTTDLAEIARYVLLVGFFVWPLRVFVRNYMSNVHLQTDAAERKIVIMTYLALLLEPELKNQNDLKMQVLPYALERIFRHSQTGIVKDEDGSPSGFHEFMSGLSKQK